jgi:hypothetical protein
VLPFLVIDDVDVVGLVGLDLDAASAGRVVFTIVMIGSNYILVDGNQSER